MVGAEAVEETDEAQRADRAHDTEAEMRAFQPQEARRLRLRRRRARHHLLEVRLHQPAELGQVGVAAPAREQQPAQLVLKLLDGAGQRGLRHVALLRRPGEIQRAADREEVADLMDFHGGSGACPRIPSLCRKGYHARALRRHDLG
jgi:hypothetical protein